MTDVSGRSPEKAPWRRRGLWAPAGNRCKLLLSRLLLGGLLLHAEPSAAARISLGAQTWIDLHLLLQPSLQLRNDLEADPTLQTDFYLRRTRFVMGGQLSKWLSFFAETDQPNWGKGGDWDPSFFVQDAFLNLNLHEALIIDGGLLIIPFVHHARQGASTLHTLDYHSDLIRYPAGSHKVWRDAGIQLRGLLVEHKVNYYLALTQGVGDTPNDTPRISGRLAFNFLEAEEGFFLAGTYLGKKRVLSLGAAFDLQQGAFGPGSSYLGVGGDVFLDLPLRRGSRISGQVDFVYYGGVRNPDSGIGLFGDLGYAVGPFEPLVAVDWYRPQGANALTEQLLGLHGGFNWWAVGHTANLKLDGAFIKLPKVPLREAAFVLTVQAQLFI